MAAKTQFSRDDLVKVLSEYEDLGDLQAAQALTADTVQTNYIIETSQSKFVFKYYENRSFESVSFEANLLLYILKRKFPCATPMKKEDGTYVGDYQNKPFVLYEFIEGEQIEQANPQQKQEIIKTAASLQSFTKNYRPQNKRYRWNYSPELCLRLAQEKATQIRDANAHAKAAWFEQALQRVDIHRSVPKGICHCDYDYANMLFDGDKLIALLDFDDANFTYLNLDLAMIIHMLAWYPQTGLNLEEARQIARDYQRTRSLMTIEKNHFFDVHKLKILFDGVWFFDDAPVEDFSHRRAIEAMDKIGRELYQQTLFS